MSILKKLNLILKLKICYLAKNLMKMKYKHILYICLMSFLFIEATAQQTVVLSLNQNDELKVSEMAYDTIIPAGSTIEVGYDLDIQGGSGNYLFSWEGDATISNTQIKNPEVSPAQNTSYSCSITDENGCSEMVQYNVTVVQPIEINSIISDVSCKGNSDGSIELVISEGLPPYTINWTSGENSLKIENLDIGNYAVEIKDSFGQTQQSTFTVSEPQDISTSYSFSDTIINDEKRIKIDLLVTGGTASYSFEWSNNETSEDIIIPDSTFNYEVIITDSNGCLDSLNILVTSIDKINSANSYHFVVYPNPNEGRFTIDISGKPNEKLVMMLSDVNGKVISKEMIQNFNGKYAYEQSVGLSPGMYYISLISEATTLTKSIIVK